MHALQHSVLLWMRRVVSQTRPCSSPGNFPRSFTIQTGNVKVRSVLLIIIDQFELDSEIGSRSPVSLLSVGVRLPSCRRHENIYRNTGTARLYRRGFFHEVPGYVGSDTKWIKKTGWYVSPDSCWLTETQ